MDAITMDIGNPASVGVVKARRSLARIGRMTVGAAGRTFGLGRRRVARGPTGNRPGSVVATMPLVDHACGVRGLAGAYVRLGGAATLAFGRGQA